MDILEAMQLIQKFAQKSLTKTQISQLNKVNKYSKEISYNMGDKLLLFIKNISID